MNDDRLSTALARAERALDRIASHAPDPALRARHDRLRAATTDALARLDRLIEVA